MKNEYFLSPKELDVLKLIAEGKDNIAIANKLNITMSTLRSHISSIYEKMDLKDNIRGESSKRVKATLIYLKEY